MIFKSAKEGVLLLSRSTYLGCQRLDIVQTLTSQTQKLTWKYMEAKFLIPQIAFARFGMRI